MAITRKTASAPTPMAPPPPPPVQQYAAAAAAPAPMGGAPGLEGPNFMELSFYSSGFITPQGNYVITDATVQMFKGEKQREDERKLGVVVTLVPLNDPRQENAKQQFYAMGTDAHKSFMPNPAHGKGIVPIPGAPAATLAGLTNWNIFLKSLYECGLPIGYVTNRVDPIEGTWVYIQHIDEPEERKGFQSKTAEVSTVQRVDKKIAVVGQILEGGKPWEGGGGWPAQPVIIDGAPPAPAVHHVAAPAPKVNGAPPPPPAPVGLDGADIRAAASNGIADILGISAAKGVNTLARLQLRNDTFNHLTSKSGEAVASAVIAQIFDAPGVLETVLGDLGYKVAGAFVMPS